MRPVWQSEELHLPKPLENLISSDDNSDSDKGHRQQEGDNVDCNLTFEAIDPHLNPAYKHKEILMTLSMILIYLNNTLNS